MRTRLLAKVVAPLALALAASTVTATAMSAALVGPSVIDVADGGMNGSSSLDKIVGEAQEFFVGTELEAAFSCQAVAAEVVASTGVGCALIGNTDNAIWKCACNLFSPGNVSADAAHATNLSSAQSYRLCTAGYLVPVQDPIPSITQFAYHCKDLV